MWGINYNFAACLIPLSALLATGCFPSYPSGSSKYTNNLLVDNGIVYEHAVLTQVAAGSQLIVPTNTKVIVDDTITRPMLAILKRQSIFAHPTKPISIEENKKRMGVVALYRETETRLATYGEYTLPGHGGTSVELTLTVPPEMKVATAEELGGPKSIGNTVVEEEAEDSAAWEKVAAVEMF